MRKCSIYHVTVVVIGRLQQDDAKTEKGYKKSGVVCPIFVDTFSNVEV